MSPQLYRARRRAHFIAAISTRSKAINQDPVITLVNVLHWFTYSHALTNLHNVDNIPADEKALKLQHGTMHVQESSKNVKK